MAEIWGPWIEHDGDGCPPAGQRAQWQFDADTGFPPGTTDAVGGFIVDSITAEGIACETECWNWLPGYLHILRYRIRRPDALRRLIDLAADPDRGMPQRFPVEELA